MKYSIMTLPLSPYIQKGNLVRTCGIIGIVTKIERKLVTVVSLTDFESKDMRVSAGDTLSADLDSLITFKDAITLQN